MDASSKKLTSGERRQYIAARLHTDWGWQNFEKGSAGLSIRDIMNACIKAHGIGNVPGNPMTYQRDIAYLREDAMLPDEETLTEARALLAPERFPEWRKKLRGEEYETPPFQHALFIFLHCLAHKTPVPDWVITLFDELDPVNPFPEDLNDLIVKQEMLLSFLFLLAPRHGKALDVETPMMTDSGWEMAGDIRVGDRLVGPDGGWVDVLEVYPQGITDAYRVVFSDGGSLIVSSDHKWEVRNRKGKTLVLSTAEIRNRGLREAGGHYKWRIPFIQPAEYDHKDLPIDPYLFGCWLGDGSTYRAEITSEDPEVLAAFDAEYTRGVRTHQNGGNALTVGYLGLMAKLRKLGVLGMKYIPETYMMASPEQRLALLQGLLDTDGSFSRSSKQIEFSNKNLHLVSAVETLVWSLGGTCRTSSRIINGIRYWRVFINPGDWEPFRLERKRPTRKKPPVRTIRSIERVPDRETVCFSVSGDRQLYAAGRGMMLTHNTDLLQDFVIHTHADDPNVKILFGNGTIKRTQQFTANYFMPVLEFHEWLNEMYGPFRHPDRSWGREGYVLHGRQGFHKSMSLQPFGISGTVLSLDADLILADDLSDLRRAQSETTTDGDYDWMTTQLMTRREPHTAYAYVGSHVSVDTGDLFERLIAKKEELSTGDHRLIIKKIPAHRYDLCDPKNDPNHEKCVMWPTKRPYSFLEAMRALIGDDAQYEAVYNQIPRQRKMMHFPADVMRNPYIHVTPAEGARVTPAPKLSDGPIGVLDGSRSWRELPIYCCGKETAVGLGFDPAASEAKGASFTALAVKAACTICGRRYWVDYGQERMSPEGHPEYIGQYTREYPQIEIATLEVNAYQKSLARDPRMETLMQRDRFYIKEWTTDERKHDPDFGIPQYGRHYKSGMVSVPYRTLYDQEFAETLIKTFIRWPQKPNDLVMAGWLCDRGLDEIIEASRHTSADLMFGSDQWRTQWHDENTYEVDLSEVYEDSEWVYR